MLRAQIRLGRIAGIGIGLHYSWFLIALLITLSLSSHFHSISSEWGRAAVWSTAVLTSVFFFITLLLHELAHSLVAKSRGLRVDSITLFALGGVSQIESEAPNARSEFWIAAAGPLTSLAIGLILVTLAKASGWATGTRPLTPITAVLLWLGYINIALAVFNMVPGYPLDGGRVLRAIAWGLTHNPNRSTRIAAGAGQAVALIFILLGLFRFFTGASLNGLWLAFIGWFLLEASRSSYLQVGLVEALRGRRVTELMDHHCTTVDASLSLQDFVDEYLLRGQRCFVVVQGNIIVGLITPNEIQKVSRDLWPQTSVQRIMRPLRQLRTVTPDTPVLEAFEIISRDDFNQLPVVSNGHFEGVLSRGHLLRYLQAHAELYGH
jgi:Zn-dependent protease/predicted transcriptional regulator